jgi:hypothetical protein
MNANEYITSGTTDAHAARDRGRRRLHRGLACAAAAAITAGALLGSVLGSAGPASAATGVSWIMGAGNINGISALDPATASHFLNTPTSFGAGSSRTRSPIQPGLATTPVLMYTSYAQFAADLRSGQLTFPYQWVMYDPEKWRQTPRDEQQDPIKYMTLFGQLAHSSGLQVIEAPALDLAYVPGSVIPRLPRESAPAWYVRNNIAGAGAAAGDAVMIQGESQTASLSRYDSLFTSAAAQARAANPEVRVFAEVSTVNGSAAQMAAAARSVSADGVYVAAPGAVRQADRFFQLMQAAGY